MPTVPIVADAGTPQKHTFGCGVTPVKSRDEKRLGQRPCRALSDPDADLIAGASRLSNSPDRSERGVSA